MFAQGVHKTSGGASLILKHAVTLAEVSKRSTSVWASCV